MVNYVPVRKGNGPLHLGIPTGRGYRTACGKPLVGSNLDVPRPRLPAFTRAARERFYAQCWELMRVCRSCDRIAP